MTDIVERLRFKSGTHVPVVDTMNEAAAEIERLRERVASLQASSGYEASIAQVEIERLRAFITELTADCPICHGLGCPPIGCGRALEPKP